MHPLPDHVQRAIGTAANGNAEAAQFLASFYRFSQTFDDLLDQDQPQPVNKTRAMAALLEWTTVLALNPFWHTHRALLLGLLVSAGMRSLAGEEWQFSVDPARRALAPAVRCGDTDLLVVVSWLTRHGDTVAAMQVSDSLRDYDTGKD